MKRNYVILPKPIDASHADTLLRIHDVATAQGIGFMLVGAFARDVFFVCGHGVPVRRNTTDLDFGLQLTDWSEYDRFRTSLSSAGFTQPSADHPEQLADQNGICVDLIPFGRIADGETKLRWRDGDSWVIAGFQDAFDDPLWVQVTGDSGTQEVRLASPPALVMLKLVSAHDRPRDRMRLRTDSSDIDFILKNYLSAGNQHRLENTDLMDVEVLDLELAGARLIGEDIRTLASEDTRRRILGILEQETGSRRRCPIAHEMRSHNGGSFTRARDLLSAIKAGLAGA